VALSGIALDTSAYSAFKRGGRDVLEVLQRCERICVPTVVLGELLAGFAIGSREARNRTELATFLDSTRVSVLPVDEQAAERYALLFRQLRKAGRPIPTNDLWIAAVALRHGLALLTLDRHYREVVGLIAGSKLSDFVS
jgi:predicted nucleic acid-binding protein